MRASHVVYAVATLLLLACVAVRAEGEEAKTETKKDDGPIIGIDLGTTYSCVGIFRQGAVEIFANDQGNRITPSYVAFTSEERLVGDAAKNQASLNPSNTVFDAKRLIGRRYSDKSVQYDKNLLPFDIVNNDGKPGIQVKVKGKKKTFAPEEISGAVLQKMKAVAEAQLGRSVTRAVITVPAYFNNAQRAATKDAAKIAGLTAERILNEPTAAAIAYGLNEQHEDRHILVYDLGGGTFDVSVLTLDGGVFEVIATNGDTHLGGEDFDQRIMNHFLKIIKSKYKADISKNKRALSKLRREAEKAKRALSSVHQTKVEIDGLIDGRDFSEVLSRAKFESLCNDLFQKTLKPVQRVLADSEMRKSDIQEVVLVGGSTRIPKVQELLSKFFNGKKLHDGINPDEAVAYGAAVQGGILSGETKGVILVDVTPLSLGIETVGGVMAKIIERNTVVPATKSESFTTEEDNQTELDTKVFQGERSKTKYNVLLGEFTLEGILPAPRGVPEIVVTFSLNTDGILKVKAVDKATDAQNSIEISADKTSRLSTDEINKMVDEAAKYAEEDALFRQAHETREQLEGYAYRMKHEINDEKKLGGKISADDKDTILAAVKNTLEWLEENREATLDEYKEQLTELEAVCHPIVRKLYGNAAEPGEERAGDEQAAGSDGDDEDPWAEDGADGHEEL